jgi:hypothetical protein
MRSLNGLMGLLNVPTDSLNGLMAVVNVRMRILNLPVGFLNVLTHRVNVSLGRLNGFLRSVNVFLPPLNDFAAPKHRSSGVNRDYCPDKDMARMAHGLTRWFADHKNPKGPDWMDEGLIFGKNTFVSGATRGVCD